MNKIIVTIGQNSFEENKINEMLTEGASILRYNLGPNLSDSEIRKRLDVLVRIDRNKYELMLDIPYPRRKIRLGYLPEYSISVKKGSCFNFISSEETTNINLFVPVRYPYIGDLVTKGQVITIGDGELALEVVEVVSRDQFKALTVSDGLFTCLKSINANGLVYENDISSNIMGLIRDYKPEIVALSFVENASDVEAAKHKVASWKYKPKIYSKIENTNGVRNIKEIAEASDAIIVARGDLAIYADPLLLGFYQNRIIDEAKKLSCSVFVSTQVLESLIYQYTPKRSELSDLYYILSKGVDGVMLAKETSSNSNASFVVRYLREFIEKFHKKESILGDVSFK